MEQVKEQPAQTPIDIRDAALRIQLLTRQTQLRAALPSARKRQDLADLLQEVDAALDRMSAGTYGICETCHEQVESEWLLVDPFMKTCIGHLSDAEQRALERDLDLAFEVQRGLLPKPVKFAGWSVAFHYEPAGTVSGDYCDVITLDKGEGIFVVGDVSGKGVAASMLMAQLNAIFRSLSAVTRSVTELVSKANRIFCEGALSSQFATLVCGLAGADGEVEICNAGHCFPLHVRQSDVSPIKLPGSPLGLFCDGEFNSAKVNVAQGESLVLYSDGVSETFNQSGDQYGAKRLSDLLRGRRDVVARDLVGLVVNDVRNFRSGAPKTDDLTMLVLQREG